MKYSHVMLLALLLGVPACSHKPFSKSSSKTAAYDLEQLSGEFIDGYLKWRPRTATSLGIHEYDGQLTDLSSNSVQKEIRRLEHTIHRLTDLQKQRLPHQADLEARLLRSAIEAELFLLRDLRAPWQNPMLYAGAIDVDIFIKRDFAPREQRLSAILSILRQAPRVMAAARSNLDARLSRPHTETAIDIAQGVADFLEKDLAIAFHDLESPEFKRLREIAVGELRDYSNWLKSEKLPFATGDFALGPQRYARMLEAIELIDLSPEELLRIGQRELQRVQAQFIATARRINPAIPAREVYSEIQRDHPTAERLITETAANLENIRQFVVDKRIVTIPSQNRVRVMESPQFMRATSFASMDTPGPFETRATEAYYYITPVEPHWPEKQKQEWLTAFNYYTTDIVSIHEAYPGHYVQFLCLNASNASRLAKMFPSYAFVEGWAHYTEQMMIEEGFSQSSPAKADKYHLAQLGEALLRLCRMCASIQIHCQGMSVDQATRFFQDNAFYEEKPARSEATRGAYDPGYLFYTVGKLQILKLREDWRLQEGAAYSLQRFHDELLASGAPPVRLLRERMLKDPAAWNALF